MTFIAGFLKDGSTLNSEKVTTDFVVQNHPEDGRESLLCRELRSDDFVFIIKMLL